MSLIVVLGFCVLMVLAIPVGHALIIAAAGAILWSGTIPVMAVAQTMFQQTQSFPMLALPFFMLAGALMMGGRLGQELLHFATEGMKRWRGGELSTTVVASVAFGGVSGSAVANASALGSILIPWQKKPRLPGRPLRRQQRHLGGHRHPDPAVDPDDPLRAGQRRQHRRPLHRRRPPRHPDGGRLRRHLLVDRQAPRLPALDRPGRPHGAAPARASSRARPSPCRS